MEPKVEEKKKPGPKPKTNLEKLIEDGIPVYYAKFQNPVAPGENKEPVSEFKIKTNHVKYKVDKMLRCPNGLIFEVNGELDIVESANVVVSRVIKEEIVGQ
jgi:hypothetical protein